MRLDSNMRGVVQKVIALTRPRRWRSSVTRAREGDG
jgi:hypothetical protein